MSEIKNTIASLTEEIKNASYAENQQKYETAYRRVFAILEELEERLDRSRYLNGDEITEDDYDFYRILVRFDTVYYFRSGLNQKRISEYENLWDYARSLYSIPEFQGQTDFEAIKTEEYLKDEAYNPLKIIPLGPDVSEWNKPSKR